MKCSACAAENLFKAPFCGQCGAPLRGETLLPSPSSPPSTTAPAQAHYLRQPKSRSSVVVISLGLAGVIIGSLSGGFGVFVYFIVGEDPKWARFIVGGIIGGIIGIIFGGIMVVDLGFLVSSGGVRGVIAVGLRGGIVGGVVGVSVGFVIVFGMVLVSDGIFEDATFVGAFIGAPFGGIGGGFIGSIVGVLVGLRKSARRIEATAISQGSGG